MLEPKWLLFLFTRMEVMQLSSEESRRVWASVKALYLMEAPCTPLHRDFLLFHDTAYRPAQQRIVGSASEVLGPVQFGPFLARRPSNPYHQCNSLRHTENQSRLNLRQA